MAGKVNKSAKGAKTLDARSRIKWGMTKTMGMEAVWQPRTFLPLGRGGTPLAAALPYITQAQIDEARRSPVDIEPASPVGKNKRASGGGVAKKQPVMKGSRAAKAKFLAGLVKGPDGDATHEDAYGWVEANMFHCGLPGCTSSVGNERRNLHSHLFHQHGYRWSRAEAGAPKHQKVIRQTPVVCSDCTQTFFLYSHWARHWREIHRPLDFNGLIGTKAWPAFEGCHDGDKMVWRSAEESAEHRNREL